MRNRAKCKLCNTIIESLSRHDYVKCECGEIALDGGTDYLRALAGDFANFIRLDDDNNEIQVTYEEKKQEENGKIEEQVSAHKPSKEELIAMLEEMIKSYENMPHWAMHQPVSHADQLSLLMIVSSLFKSI
jgi:hypothetical protein